MLALSTKKLLKFESNDIAFKVFTEYRGCVQVKFKSAFIDSESVVIFLAWENDFPGADTYSYGITIQRDSGSFIKRDLEDGTVSIKYKRAGYDFYFKIFEIPDSLVLMENITLK